MLSHYLPDLKDKLSPEAYGLIEGMAKAEVEALAEHMLAQEHEAALSARFAAAKADHHAQMFDRLFR